MTGRAWSRAEVMALGVRTDVPTAGEIIAGLCRDESYRMAKRGEFPVPVLKVGRRLVVPIAPILQLLGVGPPHMDAADPAPPVLAQSSTAHSTTGFGGRVGLSGLPVSRTRS